MSKFDKYKEAAPSKFAKYAAQKVVSEDVTEDADPSKAVHLSHGPKTSFFLNALDSASGVGLPAVMGMVDAATGRDSGAEAKSIGADPNWKAKGLLERYYQNKDFYKGGMKRLGDTNPKSAIAGQIAPAVVQMAIPGAGAVGAGTKALGAASKLKNIAKVGAVAGGTAGLLRGDSHTLDGDLAGTAVDTGIGAGVGTLAGLAGAGVGKVVEAGGNLAGKASQRIMAMVRAAAKSEQAGFAKKAQMGIGADRNIAGDLERLEEKLGFRSASPASAAAPPVKVQPPGYRGGNQTVNGSPGRAGAAPQPPTVIGPPGASQVHMPKGNTHTTAPGPGAANLKLQGGDAWMAQKGVKYDERARQNLLDLREKYGDRAMPPLKDMIARGLKGVRAGANAGLMTAAKGLAGGYVGMKAADAVGIDPKIGAAVGGLGAAFAVRKASLAAAQHPDIMGALMKLRPVGQALAISGGTGGALAAGRQTPAVRKNAAAILYSLAQKDPAVREALLRETGSGSRASPARLRDD